MLNGRKKIFAQVPCALVLALAMAWTLPAQTGKVAVITSRSWGPYAEILQAFQKTAGFETEIIDIEKNAAGLRPRLDAGGFVGMVAMGDLALTAVNGLQPGLPLVYTMVYDAAGVTHPRAAGVVLKISISEQLSRIQKLLPTKPRLGVIFNPRYSNAQINEARDNCSRYGLNVYALRVDQAADVAGALSRLGGKDVDILWMVADPMVAQPAVVQQLIKHAEHEKIGLIGLSLFHVKMGALAAISVDLSDIGAQTAQLTREAVAGNAGQAPQAPRKIVVYVNTEVQAKLKCDLQTSPEVISVP